MSRTGEAERAGFDSAVANKQGVAGPKRDLT